METEAFSPGHITGFFEVCRAKNPLATGSRGAGLCLSLGARSIVKISEAGKQSIDVAIDGRRAEAPVTRSAIRHLVGANKLSIKVSTSLDLPQSQGFGMSAAGALSASLAATELLGLGRQKAFEAAHLAEVRNKTGLGDVSAIHRGGVTLRVRPGLPPIGKVKRIDGAPTVVLAEVGRRLLTKTVLTSPAKVAAINKSGARKVKLLDKEPTLSRFMRLSVEFAFETGLATRPVQNAIDAASKLGLASMSMLGSSVFAIGDTEGLVRVLSEFGEVWVCKVDTEGPKILSAQS